MKFIAVLICTLFSMNAFAEKCTYEFDLDKSEVSGTGFKFTEKKAVKAKFLQFTLNKSEKKASVKELLDDLEVTVDLMALDSGDALRDKNLRETFFAAIIGNAEAKVQVKSVKKDVLETILHLNDKSLPVNFNYKIKGNTVEATGNFDAATFAMGDSVAALKKRCGSLHTGEDGVSKTWTEFDLAVKGVTKKVCK